MPFAADLKVVAQSPELPVAIVAIVGSRLAADRARALQAALLKMSATGSGDSLGPLRLHGFVLPKLPSQTASP